VYGPQNSEIVPGCAKDLAEQPMFFAYGGQLLLLRPEHALPDRFKVEGCSQHAPCARGQFLEVIGAQVRESVAGFFKDEAPLICSSVCNHNIGHRLHTLCLT
jgi:hypothetical protein